MRYTQATLAILIASLLLLTASCGGGTDIIQQQRAQSFTGGALSSFGGTDGSDTQARTVARAIATAREYDFIQTGYLISAGDISSVTGGASTDFGAGDGTLTIDSGQATAVLTVTSVDPSIDSITMTGTFEVSSAQAAIEDSGRSLTVHWVIEFTDDGTDLSLTADQVLTGNNWISI